jgi:hypothetical protein
MYPLLRDDNETGEKAKPYKRAEVVNSRSAI